MATHQPTTFRFESPALWQLAWPILIRQLAPVGMGVVDVTMAGHASVQGMSDCAVLAKFQAI